MSGCADFGWGGKRGCERMGLRAGLRAGLLVGHGWGGERGCELQRLGLHVWGGKRWLRGASRGWNCMRVCGWGGKWGCARMELREGLRVGQQAGRHAGRAPQAQTRPSVRRHTNEEQMQTR